MKVAKAYSERTRAPPRHIAQGGCDAFNHVTITQNTAVSLSKTRRQNGAFDLNCATRYDSAAVSTTASKFVICSSWSRSNSSKHTEYSRFACWKPFFRFSIFAGNDRSARHSDIVSFFLANSSLDANLSSAIHLKNQRLIWYMSGSMYLAHFRSRKTFSDLSDFRALSDFSDLSDFRAFNDLRAPRPPPPLPPEKSTSVSVFRTQKPSKNTSNQLK